MSKVTALVLQNTKLTVEEDETSETFTARVAAGFMALNEKGWDALPEQVQLWSNRVNEAVDGNEDIVKADLLPAEAQEEEEETEEATEDGEEEADDAAEGDEPESEDGEEAEEDGEEAEEDEEGAEEDGEEDEAPKKKEAKSKAKEKPVKKVAKTAKAGQKAKARAEEDEDERPAKKTAKKVAKGAKAKNGAGHRGRAPTFRDDQKIKLLVKENPHNAGTGRYKRWSKYRNGMTVKEALKAGLERVNLHYSVKDGHIEIR